MKRRLILILGLCAGLWPSVLPAQISFTELSLEQVRQQAGQSDQLFFLYFAADWCLPCQWMEQHTFPDPELSRYIQQHYLAVKVDVDQSYSQELKARFSVDKIPSILVYSAAGVLIDRQETSLDAPTLLNWLRELNVPANHLRPVIPTRYSRVAAEDVMDSPRPSVGFSRPALIPDEAAETALHRSNTVLPQVAPATYPSTPVAVVPEPRTQASFSPRSTQRFGIALGPQSYSYNDGIRKVVELEQKFNQPAELLPLDNGNYRITIGEFESQTDARKFLVFLNRNNLIGEILPLQR